MASIRSIHSSPSKRSTKKRKSDDDPPTSQKKIKTSPSNSDSSESQQSDESVKKDTQESQSRPPTSLYTPPSPSQPENIFSSLPGATFSPSVSPAIIRLFEEHGGTYVPYSEEFRSIDTAKQASQPHYAHYNFVAGIKDPLCSTLDDRTWVLFDTKWVKDCIDEGKMVGLGEYIIPPPQFGTEFGSKVRTEYNLALDDAQVTDNTIDERSARQASPAMEYPAQPDQSLDIDLLQHILEDIPSSRASTPAEQVEFELEQNAFLSRIPVINTSSHADAQKIIVQRALSRSAASRTSSSRRPLSKSAQRTEPIHDLCRPFHGDTNSKAGSSRIPDKSQVLSDIPVNVILPKPAPTSPISLGKKRGVSAIQLHRQSSSHVATPTVKAPSRPTKSPVFDPSLKSSKELDDHKVTAFKRGLREGVYCVLDDVYAGLLECETEKYQILGLEDARLSEMGRRRYAKD